MCELIILPNRFSRTILLICCLLWLIWLTGKTSQAFIVYVYSPRIKACDQNIYSEVELESIDEHRVCDIFADDALLVNGDFRNVIYNVYTLPLRGVLRFDDPLVVLNFLRLDLMKVRVEISELIG